MYEFDWQTFEADEYSHESAISFVKLNERNYLTASGTAEQKTADKQFQQLASALATIAAKISEGPSAGIEIPGYRTYRPYPVQAVWSGGDLEEQTNYQLWIKQPNFVASEFFDQALNLVALDDQLKSQIQYKRMAEGTEIQSYTTGDVADTIYQLEADIAKRGLNQLSKTSHREVYVDGFEPGKPALVRLAVEPNVGRIDHNRLWTN